MRQKLNFKIAALVISFMTGAVFLFAYYKLQSSEIQKAIVTEIENKIPGSKVEFGNFNYFLGPITSASIDKLKILNADKKIIALISECRIEIPVWTILFDKGTVKVKIKDSSFNLTEILKIPTEKNQSAESREDKNNKIQKDKKELPSFIKRTKLNFSLVNSQFEYEVKEKGSLNVRIKEVDLYGANVSEKFKFAVESDLTIKAKDVSVSPKLKLEGQIDLSNFINNEEIISNAKFGLKNIEYNKFSFKDLVGTLDLKLKEKNVTLNLGSSWGKSSLSLHTKVNIDKKDAEADSVIFQIYPEEILGFNPTLKEKLKIENFKVKGDGSFTYSENSSEGKFNITTDGKVQFQKGENSFINLPPSNISVKTKLKGEIADVDIKSSFLDSFLDTTAIISTNSFKITKLNSTLAYDDLWQLIPSEFQEIKSIQKKQVGNLELKGKGNIEQGNISLEMEVKNKGNFLVKREDNSALTVKDLYFSIRQSKGKHLFQVKNDVSLNIASQPSLLASSEISGDIDLDKFVKNNEIAGSLNLNSATQKIIKGKSQNSSVIKLVAGSEDGKVNVKELNGSVSLSEILSFIPAKSLKNVEKIEAGNAVAKFSGKFQIENKKILSPEFSFNVSSPLSVKMSAGYVKLQKLKASIDSFDENMNIGFSGESNFDVQPKAIDKNISSGIKFRGLFKGKDYVENKKMYVDVNVSGTTKESKFATDIKYSPEKLVVDSLSANLKLAELKALAPSSLAENLKMISPNVSSILLKGRISLQNDKILIESLSASSTSPIDFRHSSGIGGKLIFSGSIKNNKYSMATTANVFNGEVVSSFDGGGFSKLNEITMEKLFPKNIKINANNLSIDESFIKKFLYGSSTPLENKGPVAVVAMKEEDSNDSFLKKLPPFNINLNVSNLKVGKEAYFSKGDIAFKDEEFNSNNLIFKLANGYASINFKAVLKDNESHRKVNAKIYNFNLSALNGVLPPMLESVSGNFSGAISGEMLLKKKVLDAYHIDFDLNVKDGELKKLNLTDYVKEVVEKIDITKQFASKLSLKVSDQFEKLILKGNADNKKVVLSKIDFVGIKNSSSIVGNGEIAQLGTKGPSHMDFIYKDLNGKISTFLKSNVGKEEVPLKLVGEEFNLRPDYAFTIKQVGGNALKTQTDKILKKEAEKLGNKLGEKLGEKAGDLLNKLFQKK